MKRLAIVPVLVVLAACGGPPAPKEIPSAAHPVVVVAIDTLGLDAVGAYGAAGSRTPKIDALARESVRFEWAWAQAPEPGPAAASLLTGFYPGTDRVLRAGDTLAPEAKTLAEYFSEAGFESAAFASGKAVEADLGLAQGFTTFESRPGAAPGETGAKALAWMRDRTKKNFFVLIDVPGGDVAADDELVGKVVEGIRDLGLSNRATLVVLGTTGSAAPAGTEPSLDAATVRVPLLVRFPGAVRMGTVGENVELVDLAPTLLEICGVAVPGTLQGKSLVPLVKGQAKPPYVAFGESPYRGGQRFVALGGYRMVATQGGAAQVFRTAEDPQEKQDLAATEAKRASVLADHLQAYGVLVTASSVDPSRAPAALDDASLEKLKSLGYVQ